MMDPSWDVVLRQCGFGIFEGLEGIHINQLINHNYYFMC